MTNHALANHPDFSRLLDHLKDLSGLRAAASLMHWDQATYLPEKAFASRGDHLSTIEKLAHGMATSDELGRCLENLAKIEGDLSPESDEACLIRIVREDYERDRKLPADFRSEQISLSSLSYETWKKARAANDFSMVEKVLEKNVELSRKMAEYLKKPGQSSIIDSLIDLSDPGFTAETLRPLFADLRARLVPLFDRVIQDADFDDSFLRQDYPEEVQLSFGEKVIRNLGYDFERGRQDKTAHPFMIRFAHSDVRITTRVKRNDLGEALFSTIHEAGHALYELGIEESFEGTPLAQGTSSGVHESQSRLWENLVARGLPFWEHFYPKLQAVFPQQLQNVSLARFYKAINRTERGLIRTDADELSYNLHVMIRFDLECDLLEGKLRVKDLPEAWLERYRSDLGITPAPESLHSNGVLQDVHWFSGPVGGAFQGYTIGNVLSAQLYASARKAHHGLEEEFRKGNFSTLREWLRQNVHRHGRKFEGPDLIRRATGKPLSTEDYFEYLENKYTSLIDN
jgi:carboxypeptidase Taq